mmetsp:Transcript_3223/g.9828  ORF Transcript_3223/g.9828 Transcript_3223/m.9828 type:complete len:179 (-) Transcript_3223:130-666(-)|eukprot:CAMPEP_0198723444 /NCGR_PEP_ID=MMETSP1475-20131203/946_1 /TAXON_ID= ORGANISM="Unidentified sp., Strain CCMP1999" /NCGR_SAMPLE_ID=MMETSP1475 /ASSEMBLY_ACC=CAM_ASM_001111 /LENGTH=178 /DNA_ID=CAMNT_0044484565 /DNA_START=74 /DNA_END=610 /DNA_ORIENTATION=+
MLETALDLVFNLWTGEGKKEDDCELTPAAAAVVEYLKSLCDRNGSVVLPEGQQTEGLFYCYENLNAAHMKACVQRMVNMYNCSESALLLAIAYLHRAETANYLLRTNQFNIVRLFTIALTVAVKFNEDLVYCNSYYANLAGISLATFNTLESLFLTSIGFRAHVSLEEFEQIRDYLDF